MRIVIDAGVIYSALLLISVITLVLKSSFTFNMADIVSLDFVLLDPTSLMDYLRLFPLYPSFFIW
jgi:hypothetical protein